MAYPAQGFTVTWGGIALREVSEIDVQQQRGAATQRDGTWTLNLGTVKISAFATAGVAESDYSKRKRLLILCPATTVKNSTLKLTLFDRDCLYVDRSIGAVVNDAVRFDFTFRVMDTAGAST